MRVVVEAILPVAYTHLSHVYNQGCVLFSLVLYRNIILRSRQNELLMKTGEGSVTLYTFWLRSLFALRWDVHHKYPFYISCCVVWDHQSINCGCLVLLLWRVSCEKECCFCFILQLPHLLFNDYFFKSHCCIGEWENFGNVLYTACKKHVTFVVVFDASNFL